MQYHEPNLQQYAPLRKYGSRHCAHTRQAKIVTICFYNIQSADYVLFEDRQPVGVIEGKREEEGHRLTLHENQAEYYAASQLIWIADNNPFPFIYKSTGIVTRFTDRRDPKPKSRPVFAFVKPETLTEWMSRIRACAPACKIFLACIQSSGAKNYTSL